MKPANNIQNGKNGSDRKLKDLLGKEMPYQVPDGYFEGLPDHLLDACRQSRQEPKRRLYLQTGFLRIAAAAAVLIMAALVITMVFTNRPSEVEGFVEYSMDEIYFYNINSLADLEETYLLSLIESDNLDLMGLMVNKADSISDEAIMDYLLAENHIEYYIINEY
ncbi:MAG: hypothetical protein KAT76_04285 [Bacteroidales bacterium]|nr:hypothetical protein [Bacteroidales bacterium]